MNSPSADNYRQDQAHRLRSLVATAAGSDSSPLRPRLMFVTGGKKDVGTSTMAVYFASALAANGARTLLLDADAHQQDAAAGCGPPAVGPPTSDAEYGRDLTRFVRPGPYGLLVLSADDACLTAHYETRAWAGQLLDQVTRDCSLADWVVVDAGSERRWHTAALWQRADEVILVTTPDHAAVIEAYATIKRAVTGSGGVLRNIRILVNQAVDPPLAREATDRICRCCRRFLRVVVNDAGWVPHDTSIAGMRREPFTANIDWSRCHACRQLRTVLDGVRGRLQAVGPPSVAVSPSGPQRGGVPRSSGATRDAQPMEKDP